MLRSLVRRSALLTKNLSYESLTSAQRNVRHFRIVRPVASALSKKIPEVHSPTVKIVNQVTGSSSNSTLHTEIQKLVHENPSPSIDDFHQVLRGCAAEGDLQSALEVLSSMYNEDGGRHHPVVPSFETYQLLFQTARESTNVDLTIYLVKSILERKVPLIYGSNQHHEVALDFSEFTPESLENNLEVWEACLSALVSPRKMWSPDYGRLGTEALSVLQRMKEFGVRSFNENIWGLFIRTLGCTGSEASIPGVLHELLSSDEAMTPSIYSQAICAYSRCGNLPKAMELYDEMISIYGASSCKEPLWALAMNTSKAGDLASTKKLAAAAKSIDLAQSSREDSFDFMPHLLGVNVNAIRKKTGVSEKELIEHWNVLVEEIETSRETLDEECYNLYLSGYGCMNLLDPKKYPIDHVKELLISAPKKNFSPGLETYQAAMASYARTGEFADSPKLRLQRVLEIKEVMAGKGLECDSTTFHHMFEACLPYQIFAYGPEANINSFKYANLNYTFDWSVYDIERMMMKQGVSHDRKTLLAMFYVFAFGGQYESIKRRWRELSLSRVHRDRGLYTSLISILKEDHKEAIYALTVVRHQMSRESPPVEPDANLYKLLFDCCSLTKDTSATLDVLDALNTSSVQPTEAMHEALVKACLSAPRLIDRAMEVINRAKIQEITLTNATWEMMITHLLTKEKNVKEAKFTFNAYTSIRLLNRVPPSDWIRVMQAELENKKRK